MRRCSAKTEAAMSAPTPGPAVLPLSHPSHDDESYPKCSRQRAPSTAASAAASAIFAEVYGDIVYHEKVVSVAGVDTFTVASN